MQPKISVEKRKIKVQSKLNTSRILENRGSCKPFVLLVFFKVKIAKNCFSKRCGTFKQALTNWLLEFFNLAKDLSVTAGVRSTSKAATQPASFMLSLWTGLARFVLFFGFFAMDRICKI